MIKVKNWLHFVDSCSKYKYVVISGPQRSGTTYVAKELANELKYRHVDEMQHGISQINKMLAYIGNVPSIIQAPALSHKLHTLEGDDVLVVFILRNSEDICKSEDRINWQGFSGEMFSYEMEFKEHVDRICKFKNNASMKKWAWRRLQRPNMLVEYIQLPFDFIKQSKGFVKKEDRVHFRKKQTK